jgi:DedD protein
VNDGLKQRVIGAIVLVALAIVFIPIIFDENQTGPSNVELEIPKKPKISMLPIERAKPPELDAKIVERPKAPTPEVVPALPKETVDTPSIDEAALFDNANMPVSWTLQLGTFKDQNNAETLRDRLRKSGYKAYLKVDRTEKPNLSRVYIGPDLDHKRLSDIQVKLKKEIKLDGIIIRFLP